MQQYFEQMRTAGDNRTLWKCFIDFFGDRGIDELYAVQDPPPGSGESGRPIVGAHGLPHDWAERYVERRLFDRDPIRRTASRHPTPFYWHEVAGRPDLSAEERGFCAAFESLGLGGGAFFPVFGPKGRNGYLALFTRSTRPLPDATLRDYQTVAQMSHQRYCELLDETQPEGIRLSRREGEILKLVARGKSNGNIAAILGISTSTVDTHLRRIFGKLGVTDRTVASIRGIGLGLITP